MEGHREHFRVGGGETVSQALRGEDVSRFGGAVGGPRVVFALFEVEIRWIDVTRRVGYRRDADHPCVGREVRQKQLRQEEVPDMICANLENQRIYS